MRNLNASGILLLIFPALISCSTSDPLPNNSLRGTLTINGDPSATAGAQWTYTETGTVEYDLTGILYKPLGSGPFPAVIISHGTGGSVGSYSRNIANQMVKWGFVCIATNYTHASSTVPCGKPGSCDEAMGEWGASNSNLLRAMKCRQILTSLPYADTTRFFAFGHSRGAFLTAYIASHHPNRFNAFAHTAGGLNTGAEPTASTAKNITRPYLMQHGDADTVVPIQRDVDFSNLLTGNAITNSLIIYPGYSHQQISTDSIVLATTRSWFELYY